MSADQRPDPIAAMDQAQSSVAGTARLVWAFFRGLTESGFSREEALGLTHDYLLATIQAGHAQVRRAQE